MTASANKHTIINDPDFIWHRLTGRRIEPEDLADLLAFPITVERMALLMWTYTDEPHIGRIERKIIEFLSGHEVAV